MVFFCLQLALFLQSADLSCWRFNALSCIFTSWWNRLLSKLLMTRHYFRLKKNFLSPSVIFRYGYVIKLYSRTFLPPHLPIWIDSNDKYRALFYAAAGLQNYRHHCHCPISAHFCSANMPSFSNFSRHQLSTKPLARRWGGTELTHMTTRCACTRYYRNIVIYMNCSLFDNIFGIYCDNLSGSFISNANCFGTSLLARI